MEVVFEMIYGYLRGKKLRKGGEFEYGFLSNEYKFLEERVSIFEVLKEFVSFLGGSSEID